MSGEEQKSVGSAVTKIKLKQIFWVEWRGTRVRWECRSSPPLITLHPGNLLHFFRTRKMRFLPPGNRAFQKRPFSKKTLKQISGTECQEYSSPKLRKTNTKHAQRH